MNETNEQKFKRLLAELFMFDNVDLDFGIYRIMNAKHVEIRRFIDEDLLPQIRSEIEHLDQGKRAQLVEERTQRLEVLHENLVLDPENNPEIREINLALAQTVDITTLENDILSHLFDFFRRYYHEGDYLSLRRYKEGVYAIPYEGEEVKLHWANADQYYIKTSEFFRSYTFRLPDHRRVHFSLLSADTEINNNKAINGEKRVFVLCDTDSVVEQNGELIIRFEYRVDSQKHDQRELNKVAAERILNTSGFESWLVVLQRIDATPNNSKRTLLERYLSDYTSRNTFDYFIHKDLGGFLRRELDFYIKNEIMNLDDVERESAPRVETYLAKVKATRRVAKKIIDFLAQLENFQKKLWLKKKFIVEAHYCVTLDRVPENLYPDIISNEAQRIEWIYLFGINDLDGYSEPLSLGFLQANHYLLLDTKFFSEEFKYQLLASYDNIDASIDGILINSDNFQALSFLQAKYRGKVKFSYIDPPYNTDSTPIIYKNGYRHSTWATLLNDRLFLAKLLLSETGVKTVAIDDTEMVNLSIIMEGLFPDYRISRVTVVHNPKGSITKDFNRVHEYALFATKEDDKKAIARTSEENETPRRMRRWGENSSRIERPQSFYPIYVRDGRITRIGQVPADDFHPGSRNLIQDSGEIAIYPIDQNGVERRWNFGLDSIAQNTDRIVIQELDDGTLDLYLSHELTVPKTVWTGGEYDAGNYGNTLLINMLGAKRFDFPKSINLVKRCVYIATAGDPDCIVLDYFAGSGTTGHAVIALNRETGDKRKYILVEMGEYFDSVTKRRIQKAIYSENWHDGKPQDSNGISQMVKYFKLESYEDTLNNLQLTATPQQLALLEGSEQFREDYTLHYMLDVETAGSASLLNIGAFVNPFKYQLNISTGTVGETRPVSVDLVETFNYLLGLHVYRIASYEQIRLVEGENREHSKVLVIWRNQEAVSNSILDEFFQTQIGIANEYDLVYVNGDNNLENLKVGSESWRVLLIEEAFQQLMFEQ
jgi:adenine-specific DNA-methyltransferase